MRRFPVQRFRSRMKRMSGEGSDSPERLEAVLAANGTDLPGVMSGVDEVEPAPLGDAERAEDLVGGRTLLAEGFFGLVEDGVEGDEVFVNTGDELLTAERL